MSKVPPVLEKNTSAHPVLVQYLADAVMNRPLTTAVTSVTLSVVSLVALGSIVLDGVELLVLSGAKPVLQAMLSIGHG